MIPLCHRPGGAANHHFIARRLRRSRKIANLGRKTDGAPAPLRENFHT
jgi:hypothetical protein